MGYGIELSMDIRKPSNMVALQRYYRQLAIDNKCEMQYFTHEVEGKGKQIQRCVCIQVVTFSDEDFEYMLSFIRTIRNQYTNYIDCIYRDDGACTLLYASARYLKHTDKEFARNYKREKKATHIPKHNPTHTIENTNQSDCREIAPDEVAIYGALRREHHQQN
jgi:hypothetical protein